jgi:signal transduction histidine kinase
MSLRESIGKQLDLVIREDIQVSYTFDAREDLMSDFQKTQVCRIVLELLTNTIRHAGASLGSIHIQGDETVAIRYADDGKGFDPVSNGRGMGLEGIWTRVMAIGGTMVLSGGSEGMRCDISVPL